MTSSTNILSAFGLGLDIPSLISNLVGADSGNLQQMQSQSADAKDAASTLSGIGTSLSALQTAAQAISSMQDVASFTASSSDTSSVVATTTGAAQAGGYTVSVLSTAKEQRTYSASFASNSDALGQSGTISIGTASGSQDITVAATDSLAGIAAKINAAGLRVNASVFFDGSAYRLQLRGLDTGAASKLTLTEDGTSLDLNGTGDTPTAGKTVQAASDAQVSIDGFTVTRPTNQIDGIIPGVTLAVTQPTTNPVTINVAPDGNTLSTKVQAVVSAYNQVVNTIHTVAGYGSTAASVSALAGDSALRQIATQMTDVVTQGETGQGPLATLGQLGIDQAEDGTLTLDTTKLTAALTSDPTSVEKLLGRAQGATTGGLMANLSDLVDQLTAATTGALAVREQYFTTSAKNYDDDAAAEQTRLDNYATQLQTQFTAMDTAVAANQSILAQLSKI